MKRVHTTRAMFWHLSNYFRSYSSAVCRIRTREHQRRAGGSVACNTRPGCGYIDSVASLRRLSMQLPELVKPLKGTASVSLAWRTQQRTVPWFPMQLQLLLVAQ